ncbi:hypothetical protein [Pseudomonas weihenstephanensis]|uniref:hypothetical protein n=1 Tax=Pseudomonas weihenstephanensis TaxID=1608994 RepID=UPI0006534B50|nr:hypothetical protein [Pseudomonas weihenstephanensis]
MSDAIKAISVNGNLAYARLQPDTQRAIAVGAALELISNRVLSSASVHLSQEMEKLATYADQIQEALKSK